MASQYRGRRTSPRPAATVRTARHARQSGSRRPGQARQRSALRIAVVLACAAVLAGALASLPDARATISTSRFIPVADAYVSQARPHRNFGSAPVLHSDAFPKVQRSYLRFKVADLAGSVVAARLRLYANTGSQGGFAVRSIADLDWTEDTITYANASTPGLIVATSGPVAADTWASVDVTALVGGAGVVDLMVTANGWSAGQYASRETGPTAPQLLVETVATTTSNAATAGSWVTTSTAGTITTRAIRMTTGAGATTTATALTTTTVTTRLPPSAAPPPPGGYFKLVSAGNWGSLPAGSTCKGRVHASSWEPRPDNTKRNHVMPDPAAVRAAFAARPRVVDGAYEVRWDSWLLARVDGQFTGTTDEIFQWAACKWGLPDDLLRAIAVRESTWYQYLTYPSGRPVPDYGSGDVFAAPSAASKVYCQFVARQGYEYQQDQGAGICPKTFSIVGVMSWQDPGWGVWPDNQNGTFPFNRDSTAFAVDYLASQLRGCYEGWESWLGQTGTRRYGAGDLWGCVGAWYAGEWHSAAADGYLEAVRQSMDSRPWLDPNWPKDKPSCNTRYGCPGRDPL
jgi:hypothetical protein